MDVKAGGHCGPALQIHQMVIHGDPLSPTIFNVVVDSVIRHWAKAVGGGGGQEGAGQEGLGNSTQELSALLYSDDILVALPERSRLQGEFDALTGLFHCVGLWNNKEKIVSTACQTCHALHVWSMEAYTWRVMGMGLSYKERLRQLLHCLD